MRRVAILAILAFVLGCSLPGIFAYRAATSRQRPINVVNDFDAAAAARGWPATTPTPWPAPRQWKEDRRFAYRSVNIYAGEAGQTSHQMQFEQVGWPGTVSQRVQYWWPSDSGPQPATAPNMEWTIVWSSAVPTTLASGALSMLILAGPLGAFVLARRNRRRRRGLCVECGHPCAGLGHCPECGALNPTTAHAVR